MRSISIVWSTADVQEVRPDLDEEQAYQVLLLAERRHDANDGISWQTLEIWADYLYPEPDDDEEDDGREDEK